MRYKDHILRAMNTDVEHLNLKENMLMNRTRCLILYGAQYKMWHGQNVGRST